jgi:type I restriction enzyme S subunit
MRAKAYPKYKNSGIEWLGKVPEHWEAMRLKFFLQEKLMYGANESAEDDNPDNPRFVRITDIDDNGQLRNDTFKSLPIDIATPYLLEDGDMLLARSGATVGKSIRYRKTWGICCFAGYLIRARVKKTKIIPEFLDACCQSDFYWQYVVGSQIQATIQNVSAEKYDNFALPLPPLPGQQSIASFLDRETGQIDTLIDKKQRIVELLKEKRTALISRAVTKGLNPKGRMKPSGVEWLGEVPEHWEVSRFRRLVKSIQNGTSSTQVDEIQDMIPVTRIETISKGKVDFERIGYVEPFEAFERYRLNIGDLLLSHINSLSMIGNCAIFESKSPLFSGMNLLRIVPNSLAFPKWLWYFVISDRFKKTLSSRAKPAINQASLTTNQIREMNVVIPPLSEQQSISSFLDRETAKIDKLISKVEEAILKLKEYRTAIISAAVTGKIDVREAA